MAEEVDTLEITRELQALEMQISEIQIRMATAVNASAPDFLNYNVSVQSLLEKISAVQTTIGELQSRVEAFQITEDSLLRCDSLTILRRLMKLDCVTQVINTILQINKFINLFNNAFNGYQPDIASDCLHSAFSLLDTVNEHLKKLARFSDYPGLQVPVAQMSTHPEEEDYVCLVHYFKLQLLGKQNQLNQLVDDRFDHFIKFFPQNVEVSLASYDHDSVASLLTLEQLWHAAKGSPSIKDRLAQLITQLIENIIDPMATSIASLAPGRILTCKKILTGIGSGASSLCEVKGPTTDNHTQHSLSEPCSLPCPSRMSPSTAIWTCVECHDSNPNIFEGSTKQIHLMISVLENLFEFISKHFFPGHPDLLEMMGKMLWPDLSSFLQDRVAEIQVPRATLDRLRDFETKLQGLHILPFTTNTLASFSSQYDHIVFNTQGAQLLMDIRHLCSSSDPTLVAIGENENHDVLLQHVHAILETLKNDPNTSARLVSSLEPSPLVLPKCNVSKAVYETVAKIDQLLKNVLDCIREKDLDDNHLIPTLDTVRHAASFFVFLRVSLYHNQLITDAQYAAVFYNDLLFLSRRMLLLLPTVEKHIPRAIQAKQCQISLLDVIMTIHPVQEEIFNAMLVYQRNQLVNLCKDLSCITSLSYDQNYMAAEAKIAEVIQSLKSLLGIWLNILESELLARSFGRLLDTFLASLLEQICEQMKGLTSLALSDANALCFLLSSTRDQLTPVVYSVSLIKQHTRLWSVFNFFKELIEADAPQFVLRKCEIREVFPLDYVKTILAINTRRTVPYSELLDLILSSD